MTMLADHQKVERFSALIGETLPLMTIWVTGATT
jgi:hypothetical protein